MCDICNKLGEPDTCQNCGHAICWDGDYEMGAWPRAAYVSSYGDVYCFVCGGRVDAENERMEAEEAEEWGWMPGPWND